VSKLPHSIEKRLMGVTLQIQCVQILRCEGRRVQLAVFAQRRSAWTTSTSARRHVQPQRRVGNPHGDRLSYRRVEQ
jgi:hypothetical protein